MYVTCVCVYKEREMEWGKGGSVHIYLVESCHSVVSLYRYESWTIKKAERGRIDAFELWCWRRLLRVLWTARRSN